MLSVNRVQGPHVSSFQYPPNFPNEPIYETIARYCPSQLFLYICSIFSIIYGGDRRWSVRRGLRVRSEMEGEDEGEGEIVDGG